MKLHFDANLEYQLAAINAACDLFRGQETCRTEFTVAHDAQYQLSFAQNDLGIGNRLTLLDDELLNNLNDIQTRNGLRPSSDFSSGDFTVEMETGTGKTYVYLRTIFELNKRFGFTKFVIVVPSVAIKEGVYKTLQITEEHFKSLYAGTPFDYFLYDSAKLGQVRNFATSPTLQIMVVTVGAINKKEVNNLYKPSEKVNDQAPIDLIKATRPVIIVDEPQSVDGGLSGAGKAALDAMNPLCTLRYSATHADQYHMVFRLDAIDAYERKLVKQIEIASATIENAHNRPFVRLISVANKRGAISAKVELDMLTPSGVQRRAVSVQDGDDLQLATNRAIYADCRIGEIRVQKDNEFLELRVPGDTVYLNLSDRDSWDDVNPLAVEREMIRRTIREHLEKEKRLRPRGIKVLSLFFIGRVDRYRRYDAAGKPVKGIYAGIFEEEYRRAARHPDFQSLFAKIDLTHAAEEVHDGYFSVDRVGSWTEPDLDKGGEFRNQSSRDDAERAYNLIMKDKERLLSFETPLKFIFSHSALREGWDNPNIFQICTLRDMRSERERRQTIGRGLRLCVNQQGERIRGFDVNRLTVIATESYEAFAENLQKEIESETGIRFGVLEDHQFSGILVPINGGETKPLGFAESQALFGYLKNVALIDRNGRVQESLKKALQDGSLSLPAKFAPLLPQVIEVLRKTVGRLEIKNRDERRTVPLRKEVYLSPDFKELWDRIKHKTTYRVAFDNEKLIRVCIDAVREAPAIVRTRLQWRRADLAIGKSGVEATEREGASTISLEEGDIELPDLLTDLQDRTQLTRRTIVQILGECGRLADFTRNPQKFIETVGALINRAKHLAIVDGIKYQRVGDNDYYAQELFQSEELTGYLKNMLPGSVRSLYESVVCDSIVERKFGEELNSNSDVKLYAKLPGWFKVQTPLGGYNPDWAVLIERDGQERLYLVVETKGSLLPGALRGTEVAKMECGEAHFKALATGPNPAHFAKATSVTDILSSSPSP